MRTIVAVAHRCCHNRVLVAANNKRIIGILAISSSSPEPIFYFRHGICIIMLSARVCWTWCRHWFIFLRPLHWCTLYTLNHTCYNYKKKCTFVHIIFINWIVFIYMFLFIEKLYCLRFILSKNVNMGECLCLFKSVWVLYSVCTVECVFIMYYCTAVLLDMSQIRIWRSMTIAEWFCRYWIRTIDRSSSKKLYVSFGLFINIRNTKTDLVRVYCCDECYSCDLYFGWTIP